MVERNGGEDVGMSWVQTEENTVESKNKVWVTERRKVRKRRGERRKGKIKETRERLTTGQERKEI